jgi:sulfur carrier protein ThiS
MKVTIKLYATLRDYLPKDGNGTQAVLELPATATIPDALAVLGVPLAQAHIVLINNRHVLRPDMATRQLRDGDAVAVFPAIGGG